MKQKKSNFLFNIAATGIIGVGVMASTIATIARKSNDQQALPTQDVSMFANSAYIPTLASATTAEQVASLQEATINKYAAMINFYNIQYAGKTSKHIDVQKEVGIMKRDFANFKPATASIKSKDPSSNPPTVHEQKYNFIRQTANNLGFDVLDTYRLEHYQNVQDTQRLYNTLVSQGFSTTEAKAQADTYLTTLNKFANRAKTQMLSPQDYAMDLSSSQQVKTLQKQNVTLYSRKTKSLKATQDNFTAAQHQALMMLTANLNVKLRAKEAQEVHGFTETLVAYSKDGKYKTGSIISPQDLGKLFTYDYDISVGADLSDYAFDTTETPADETTDTYANRVTSITKDFDTFEGSDGTLSQGEFLPGYVAHAKILNYNYTHDSHHASVSLQFGVSTTNDQDNILWADVDPAYINKVGTDAAKGGVMQLDVSVSDKQMQYVAQQSFYPDLKNVSITLDHTDEDVQAQAYFLGTIDLREKLDTLLAHAHVDSLTGEYDLQNHPLYIRLSDVIDHNDYAGIPISPEIQWFFDHPNELLYGHQTLALKITDMDYDEQWLEICWCIIDLEDNTVPPQSTQQQGGVKTAARDSLGQLEVKTIPWLVNGAEKPYIRVCYPTDTSTKAQILLANQILIFWSGIQAAVDVCNSIDQEKWDNMTKKYEADKWLNIIVDVTTAALIAFDIGIVILNALAFGGLTKEVIYSSLFTLLDALILVTVAMQTEAQMKDRERYSKIYEAVKAVPSCSQDIHAFTDDFLGDVKEFKSRSHIIQDPKYNIPDRKKAATEVIARNTEMFTDNSQYTGFLQLLRYTDKNNTWSFHDDILQMTQTELKTLSTQNLDNTHLLNVVGNILSKSFIGVIRVWRYVINIGKVMGEVFASAFAKRVAKCDVQWFIHDSAEVLVEEKSAEQLVVEQKTFDVSAEDVTRGVQSVAKSEDFAATGARIVNETLNGLKEAHKATYVTAMANLSTVIAIVGGVSIAISIIDALVEKLG